MNGKDLLAVLVMIVPTFLLIALIVLTLVPASAVAPTTGAAPVREASANAEPPMATQKRMRDPWKNLPNARTLKASTQ